MKVLVWKWVHYSLHVESHDTIADAVGYAWSMEAYEQGVLEGMEVLTDPPLDKPWLNRGECRKLPEWQARDAAEDAEVEASRARPITHSVELYAPEQLEPQRRHRWVVCSAHHDAQSAERSRAELADFVGDRRVRITELGRVE